MLKKTRTRWALTHLKQTHQFNDSVKFVLQDTFKLLICLKVVVHGEDLLN